MTQTAAPRRNRLERGGAPTLAFRHHPGRTPGVLFCPGFNSDMRGLKALALEARCLREGRQYTCFDYSAHGKSEGSFADCGIGQWRRDCRDIMDAITEGPQVLVGSSMGGWLSLLLAQDRPERAVALLGLAAAPDFTERLYASHVTPPRAEALATQGYFELPNDYDDGEPYRIYRHLLEEARAHLLLAAPIELDIPVHLIHGQRDLDVPWEVSLEVASRLASDRVTVELLKLGDHRLSTPPVLRVINRALDELLSAVSTTG